MVLGVAKLYAYSVIVPRVTLWGRAKMIKRGRGSLKVGVVAKFFVRFAHNYTYNPTILKILDPPLEYTSRFKGCILYQLTWQKLISHLTEILSQS